MGDTTKASLEPIRPIIFAWNRDVILAVSKSGSSTISRHVGTRNRCPAGEVKHKKRRITFIRDPIPRLVSCYKFWKFKQKRWPIPLKKKLVEGWEDFVNYVLDGYQNKHWVPQDQVLRYTGEFMANEVYVLEDLDKFLQCELGVKNLDRTNTTHDVPFEGNLEYRADELERYFAADYILRANAQPYVPFQLRNKT